MSGVGCPVCGANHAVCGAPTTTLPIDTEIKEAAMAGELKKYEVTNERGVTGVFKMTAEHAKLVGGKPVEKKAAAAPANKSRTAANKKA